MNKSNLHNALSELGLAGNEVKVYLALLELGSALAGEITKESGVNRTNVYDALDRLIEKGLVSYVISANRKHFEATSFEQFTHYFEEKEKELAQKKQLLKKITPQLKKHRALSKQTQEATIYKGKKGIKSIAQDVINTKKELLVMGAEGKFVELLESYANNWHKQRAQQNISVKIIFNETQRKLKTKSAKKWKKITMRFTQQNLSPSTTWIYGDTVAIIVWTNQPFATLIRSKEVAQSHKEFFKVLWKNAKPISSSDTQTLC